MKDVLNLREEKLLYIKLTGEEEEIKKEEEEVNRFYYCYYFYYYHLSAVEKFKTKLLYL